MTTPHAVHFGPRLVGKPTGTLRAAILVKPTPSIERAKPVPGEPGAVYARALEQHSILAKTLVFFGVEVVLFDPHGEDPYEASAADAAVVLEDGAMLMRPTQMARRGEADRMESEFARIDIPLAGHIAAPGLLDGGDILLAGNTAFVGVGSRGNALGRNGFSQVASAHGYRVVEIPLAPGSPSLRSIAGVVAKDTVVLCAGLIDPSAFAGFKTILIESGEDLAAGVLPLGEHHVIAEMRYRTSLRALRKAGVAVESIDLYEFTKIGITPSMLVLALKRD
jgi:dimethylargininase